MELAAAAPLSRVRIWDGSTPWLITGYEEARALFADSRVSVDDRKPGFPHWNEHMLATVDKRPRSVFTADAEEHTFYRRMLSKPFTFKRVEGSASGDPEDHRWRHRQDPGRPKPAELVTALALPVPTEVICEMLGVPYEDHGFFQGSTPTSGWPVTPPEDSMKGAMSLARYLSNLVETKMRIQPRMRCRISRSGSRPGRSVSRRPRSWPAACSSRATRPPPT